MRNDTDYIEDSYTIEDNRPPKKKRDRKDVIKNILIVFLIIMLVMTFFSNTFMNLTLPQVATAAVQSGEISPAVRGSGTAEVEDPANVTVAEARKIKSVDVKKGDEVKKGQNLYTLEDEESADLTAAQKELSDATASFNKTLFSGDLDSSTVSRIRQGNFLTDDQMQAKISSAQTTLANAQSADTKAQSWVDSATASGNADQLAKAQAYKTKTAADLSAAQSAKDAAVKAISEEIDLQGQYQTMQAAQKKVDDLKKSAVGATITAPVDGKVISLAYTTGDTTTAGQTAAVLQPKGKGLLVSFTCTRTQAQTLKVGDTATPQNAWNYADTFKATLRSITNDKQDPNNSRVLTFEISSSEVSSGDEVQLQIGGSGRNYDMTVPNSAIREDSNGKFVLSIVSRQSPLGNRYIARRVEVTVQDSDDTTSAITGSFGDDMYVITTSTRPVSAGDQVRLSEDTGE